MTSTSIDPATHSRRRSSVLSTHSNSSIATVFNEGTPLIPKVNKALTEPTTYYKEAWWLFSNSLPIVVTYLLQTSLQMASVFALGHIVSLYCLSIFQSVRRLRIEIDFLYRVRRNWLLRHWPTCLQLCLRGVSRLEQQLLWTPCYHKLGLEPQIKH